MMEIYTFMSSILTTGIQFYLCLWFITKVLGFTLKQRNAILCTLGGGILAALMSYLPISVMLRLEFYELILFLIVYFLFRQKLRMCLFLSFFYEIGVALWDFLGSSLFGIITGNAQFIKVPSPLYLSAVWVIRLLMCGLALYFYRLEHKETYPETTVQTADSHEQEPSATTQTNRSIPFRIASYIAIFTMFGVIALSFQMRIPINKDDYDLYMILSPMLLFSVLTYNLSHQYTMEKKIADLKTVQAEMLEHEYQMLSSTYSANAKLYHDLHNHLEILHHYLTEGNNEEALSYLEKLRAPIQEITQTVWTGDEALDYLINSKLAYAEQLSVKVSINIEFPHHMNINNADLTAILGNLLDNALEASKKTSTSERFLTLTIRRINQMLVIKVENACDTAPAFIDDKPVTTKEDAIHHGWGLKSASSAVAKYDGTLATSYQDGVFRAVVTMSFQAV